MRIIWGNQTVTKRGTRFSFGAERRWLMLLFAVALAPLAVFQVLHVNEQRAILESHEHVSLDGIAVRLAIALNSS